jgi:UDP-N-acetylmuramate--alanine ligase
MFREWAFVDVMVNGKICLRVSPSASIQNKESQEFDEAMQRPRTEEDQETNRAEIPERMLIDVQRQRLDLIENGRITATYPVSTSSRGTGTDEGSFKTPTGRFRIHAKIGDGAPPWMSFKGRLPTGEIAQPGGDEDLILSRILWLDGLDRENSNTRDRYIYIHGTNQETLIGSPASHGCIRLLNSDVIELYDRVEEGDLLVIKS